MIVYNNEINDPFLSAIKEEQGNAVFSVLLVTCNGSVKAFTICAFWS